MGNFSTGESKSEENLTTPNAGCGLLFSSWKYNFDRAGKAVYIGNR